MGGFLLLIMKRRVTLGMAKLAKEKGFDWPIKRVYRLQEKESQKPKTYKVLKSNYNSLSNKATYISAPSLIKLHKWLRETHNIYIVPCPHRSGKILCEVYNFNNNNVSGYTNVEGISSDSWEGALEQGLYEALKLL
jgi:hypothetical protein